MRIGKDNPSRENKSYFVSFLSKVLECDAHLPSRYEDIIRPLFDNYMDRNFADQAHSDRFRQLVGQIMNIRSLARILVQMVEKEAEETVGRSKVADKLKRETLLQSLGSNEAEWNACKLSDFFPVSDDGDVSLTMHYQSMDFPSGRTSDISFVDWLWGKKDRIQIGSFSLTASAWARIFREMRARSLGEWECRINCQGKRLHTFGNYVPAFLQTADVLQLRGCDDALVSAETLKQCSKGDAGEGDGLWGNSPRKLKLVGSPEMSVPGLARLLSLLAPRLKDLEVVLDAASRLMLSKAMIAKGVGREYAESLLHIPPSHPVQA